MASTMTDETRAQVLAAASAASSAALDLIECVRQGEVWPSDNVGSGDVHLTRFNQNGEGSGADEPGSERSSRGADEPLATICASTVHAAEIRAFLIKYYGVDQDPRLEQPLHTVTTRDRFGLVTVDIAGEPWAIVDIGMRMLSPRELFRAQGFPDSYAIDPELNGKPLTKTAQIRAAGNSVCPPVAAALVRANCTVGAEQGVAA